MVYYRYITNRGEPMSRVGNRAPRWSTWLTHLHVPLYRLTGGIIGYRLGPAHTMLLTTIGRRSGLPRITPITFFKDATTYLIVASNWGSDQPPLWYHNLVAHPQVEIQVCRHHFSATASVITGDERKRLWETLIQQWPQYKGYQEATNREIPIVAIRPLA
jgi:deazaflavin-dependent oxidoreductase (nitroreductase family)